MKGKRRRRILLILVVLLILVASLVFGWHLWSTRGYRQVEGIYLADGGQSFIEIRAGQFGRLHVVDGYIQATTSPVGVTPIVQTEAAFQHGVLRIRQKEVFPYISPPTSSGKRKRSKSIGVLHLELRPGAGGDWDLCRGDSRLLGTKSFFRIVSELWEALIAGRMRVLGNRAVEYYERVIRRKPYVAYAFPVGASPLRSFLHRVDDLRITEYFDARRQWDNPKACLRLIQSLRADHPDDRFLMPHHAELEAVAGDMDKAREIQAAWESRYGSTAGPLLAVVGRRAWQTIQRIQWERDHPHLPSLMAVFPRSSVHAPAPLPAPYDRTLDGRTRFFRDRSRADGIRFSPNPIVMTSERIRTGMHVSVPNFLEYQTAAKCARNLALLALLGGDREEALKLLIGIYRMGQDCQADDSNLITKLIGIAIRNIALNGLTVYALNACETEAELARFAARIDAIASERGRPSPEEVLLNEMSPLQVQMTDGSGYRPNADEAMTRARCVDARMANVRAACHARLRFLQDATFPASRSELAALFATNPPLDPFTSNTLPIGCEATTGGCVVYSIGPNGVDERGAFEYDPTNGTHSAGDIRVVVPREREYPFPRGGLRAADAREVLEVFPNGLPTDMCPRRQFSPGTRAAYPNFSILDATTTTPVVVFSGGTVSDGTAVTSPTLWNFAIPERQPVYRRTFTEPARPGDYALRPFYDPTNGAMSAGDLFVEIPKP